MLAFTKFTSLVKFKDVQTYWYRLTVVSFSQYNIFFSKITAIVPLPAFCMILLLKALASLLLRVAKLCFLILIEILILNARERLFFLLL